MNSCRQLAQPPAPRRSHRLLRSLLVATALSSAQAFDILFVAHDAGESLTLRAAMVSLAAAGVQITVFALGEPASQLFSDAASIKTLSPADVGITLKIPDGFDRNLTLGEADLQRVMHAFWMPRLVVVGMAYEMQAQLAASFRSRAPPSYVVGVSDGFALWDPSSPLHKAFVSPKRRVLDELFCADSLAASAAHAQSAGRVRATVTGSGTLGQWHQYAQNTTQVHATRAQILTAHAPVWDTASRIIVFAGGYGGEAYTRGLRIFCGAILALRNASDLVFVFSPHPGYAPQHERGLFEAWGCLPQRGSTLKVVSPTSEWRAPGGRLLSTAELVAASDGSLSLDSTVGGQSLSIGKPHAYLSPHYRDVFSAAALIPRAPTVGELVEAVNATFRRERFRIAKDALSIAGVPVNGSANQEARLRQLLGP